MTAAFLQSELSSLIQDSKRRFGDVRAAAEKSLSDLKAISVTSEAQLAGDLQKRPLFIEPFVLGSKSKNVRICATSTNCLQRLIASTAVSRARLSDVLGAFHDAAPMGLEIQLKVLQALPSLLQLYGSDLHGESLAKTITLSADLAGNKSSLVSNTAAATFQQLIATVFELEATRSRGRDSDRRGSTSNTAKVSTDGTLVFCDICAIVSGTELKFIQLRSLSPQLVLETLENIISNHIYILRDPECMQTCKQDLIPGLIKILENSNSFPLVVRGFRILFLLASRQLSFLHVDMEPAFQSILTLLDRGVHTSWKRILCLEFFRSVCMDFRMLKLIFAMYDQQDNRKNIISELVAVMVRITSEDPSLIGLGRQSTIPVNRATDTSSDVTSSYDIPGFGATLGSVAAASVNVTGISREWSSLANPCLDQFDRSTAPEIPDTYIYTLVLGCISAISDGLSKYVMPLSVPPRSLSISHSTGENEEIAGVQEDSQRVSTTQKYQRLLNPLARRDLPESAEAQICARIIESCWPATLAICSTFLNAAIDSYFYHILVRTVQKLTQVSGVLELQTPRDALLTTLAKVSVPVNISALMTLHHGSTPAKSSSAGVDRDADDTVLNSPVPSTPSQSIDLSRQNLNVRNLLCLRALLNLGIALGPTLSESAWSIILQCLQQVEALMLVGANTKTNSSNPGTAPLQDSGEHSTLATEISAVGTATRRMLESTRTYTDSSLASIITALFRMIDDLFPTNSHEMPRAPVDGTSGLNVSTHKVTRSTSGQWAKPVTLQVEVTFVLKTIADLSRCNLERFVSSSAHGCSWGLIVTQLLVLVKNRTINQRLRIQAANIVDIIVLETAKLSDQPVDGDKSDGKSVLLNHGLPTLLGQLRIFMDDIDSKSQVLVSAETEMHRHLLEALEGIVGHCGDFLGPGWETILVILYESISPVKKPMSHQSPNMISKPEFQEDQSKILTVSFRIVQLILSDFLNALDGVSLTNLILLLKLFGSQTIELNISLTSTALFWNLSSTLSERTESIDASTEIAMVQSWRVQSSEDKPDAADVWMANLSALTELCSDERIDIRNASVRMVSRILQASGDRLTGRAWNVTISSILLPAVQKQLEEPSTHDAEHDKTIAQLLRGLLSSMREYAEVILTEPVFHHTWQSFMTTFDKYLQRGKLSASMTAFECLSDLLEVVHITKQSRRDFAVAGLLLPVWQFWLNYHPATLVSGDDSNQPALAIHSHVLVNIYVCDAHALINFPINDEGVSTLILNSLRQTVLMCVHPKYSNDVNALSPEQQEVVRIMEVVDIITASSIEFVQFLLEISSRCIDVTVGSESSREFAAVRTKAVQKPTYNAFVTKCINMARNVVQKKSKERSSFLEFPASAALNCYSDISSWTKFVNITTSKQNPLWQVATTAIVEVLEAVSSHIELADADTVEPFNTSLNASLDGILDASALSTMAKKPSGEAIIADEDFDMRYFTRFHKAALPLLHLDIFPIEGQHKYVMRIFEASLIAKPWYGDLPENLYSAPLKNLRILRPGSIRPPEFPARQRICYSALSALFNLVSQPTDHSPSTTTTSQQMVPHALAHIAAPYVLLRIAHAIKVFISDQRLRHLNPPTRPLQKELNMILNSALELQCDDEAFNDLPGINAPVRNDGKTHLRILYSLIIQLKSFWTQLPRLKVCAWQDNADGQGIAQALSKWDASVSEGWEGLQ